MAWRLAAGQELDPVGKVPSLGGGDLLATAVGLVEVHAASPRVAATPQGGGQLARRPDRGRPRRSAQRVEPAVGDGVEGGLAAGPEAGDRPPGPAAQGARRGAPPSRMPAGPGHLEGHQGPQGRATPAGRPVSSSAGDPEAGQVVGRQVDPAGAGVLGDVLPVFGQLQPGADRRRTSPCCQWRGGAEGGQDQPSDRVGRQAAVVDQVVEGGVGGRPPGPAGWRRSDRASRSRVGAEARDGAGRAGRPAGAGLACSGSARASSGLAGQPVQGGQPVAVVVVARSSRPAGRSRRRPAGGPGVSPPEQAGTPPGSSRRRPGPGSSPASGRPAGPRSARPGWTEGGRDAGTSVRK